MVLRYHSLSLEYFPHTTQFTLPWPPKPPNQSSTFAVVEDSVLVIHMHTHTHSLTHALTQLPWYQRALLILQTSEPGSSRTCQNLHEDLRSCERIWLMEETTTTHKTDARLFKKKPSPCEPMLHSKPNQGHRSTVA